MKLGRRSDLLTENVSGEVVVLDREGGKIHRLNETAACIWEQCDGTRTESEIAEEVAGRFNVSPDVARKDVSRLIGEFASLGLLMTQPESTRG